MAAHGDIYRSGDNPPASKFYERGKFGRLFPQLPPFADDTPAIRDMLRKLGASRELMDARDRLDLGPQELITDANLSAGNPDNPHLRAGMTFLGQFLDHDMTLDAASSLERQVDPEMIENFRCPVLELDSVYGMGPTASPYLYNREIDSGLTSLLVEEIPGSGELTRDGSIKYDVPRNRQGVALIGDPRNDENLVISQLHVAFSKFHNTVVERLKADHGSRPPHWIFSEAQRLVRWHYQWIILHEFLPRTVGPAVLDDVLQHGRRFFHWRNEPFIPVEFSVGAYRFGHSQVRPSYRVNFGPRKGREFFAFIFNDSPGPSGDPHDPDDMRGGVRAARRFIDWQTFFDFGDNLSRRNKLIDMKVSTPLFDLPGIPSFEPQSLPQRNLLRSLTFKVPSGQSVARAMGLPELSPGDLDLLQPYGFQESTPLWAYILREAEIVEEGERLGPVGARIVAEVFVGLLEGDSMSYLRQYPLWKPTLTGNGAFVITDLLKIAGVVTSL